jgi:hypothetical protein
MRTDKDCGMKAFYFGMVSSEECKGESQALQVH